MVLAHLPQRRHVSHNISPSSTSPELLHDPLITLNSETYLSSLFTPPTPDISYINLSTADDDDVYFGSNQSSPFEQTTFASSTPDTQLMTGSPSQNPRLRVQQSTPSAVDLSYSSPPMSGGSSHGLSQPQFWSHLSAQPQQQYNQPVYSTHKRLSSESSIGSAGPASPFTVPATYPHIVDTESQSVSSPHFDSLDNIYPNSIQFVKPLPAHTSPLNNGTLFHHPYNLQPDINNAGQYIAQQSSMRSGMGGQQASSRSGGRNVTSEQSFGNGFEGSADARAPPNLDRTMSDACQDELYNPENYRQREQPPQPSQAQQTQVNLLSPYRQTFTERLQAANGGRTTSPTTSMPRERSPFREGSELYSSQEFAQNPNFSGRMNSAQQIREAQIRQAADAQVYRNHLPQNSNQDYASPATISPQEVSLDYHESEDESKNFPLFPQSNSQVKEQSSLSGSTLTSRNQLESYNTARSGPSSYPTSSSAQPSNPQLAFMPPSVPGTNVPQAYPFITHPRRSHNASDQAPEFPSTLSSMESTKSDSGSGESLRPTGFGSQPDSQETSSQEAKISSSPLARPNDTSANGGSYTCVAPDCHARFDASSKLQKHRREAHPSSKINISTIRASVSPYHAPASPTTPSSATNSQAAANNLSRNNQPGPHKCERINPSTGKPCNTVFSRSYDLTRHEDTIHSNRKHKVRCHLCVEEKTFSRNDALTRHMRVVHPEVDMGGKGKRSGRP